MYLRKLHFPIKLPPQFEFRITLTHSKQLVVHKDNGIKGRGWLLCKNFARNHTQFASSSQSEYFYAGWITLVLSWRCFFHSKNNKSFLHSSSSWLVWWGLLFAPVWIKTVDKKVKYGLKTLWFRALVYVHGFDNCRNYAVHDETRLPKDKLIRRSRSFLFLISLARLIS